MLCQHPIDRFVQVTRGGHDRYLRASSCLHLLKYPLESIRRGRSHRRSGTLNQGPPEKAIALPVDMAVSYLVARLRYLRHEARVADKTLRIAALEQSRHLTVERLALRIECKNKLASAIRSVRHRLQEAATEKLFYVHCVLLARW